MPISGPLVKAKAENFAEELGLTSFKASKGWLGKFKQRHHINYGKISGEARSVDKGVKCVGGKLSKERITVLVAANMDGTEKKANDNRQIEKSALF